MIKSLRLWDFKNFADATVTFAPFTVLIGANASGKSNIRDALRFLHGLGLGYTLAETIGEKYGEGGTRLWQGIRGGTREAARHGKKRFAVRVAIDLPERSAPARYLIQVQVGDAPRVIQESLHVPGYRYPLFTTHSDGRGLGSDSRMVNAKVYQKSRGANPTYDFLRDRPILTQMQDDRRAQPAVRDLVRAVVAELASMRFMDLSPEKMREASIPGQTRLSDRGENLSSVLESLCDDPKRKAALLGWVQALTPMDVVDFEFPRDLQGRTLVTLVEGEQRMTSAASASDGTLRFLAMTAALLSSETARLYFLEELDNGIHPTRVSLLLQLIEQRVAQDTIQVIATTHSPSMLRQLGPEAREAATLVYRLEGHSTAQTKRVVEIPEARHVLEGRDIGRLFEAGWMETSVAFAEDDEAQ